MPFLLEISLLNHELQISKFQKSSRKSSSPPPPPNDTPTFYKPGKNMKQSQTSGTVQIKPNARTEYPQVINDEKETVNELGRSPSFDVPWSYPTKNKLYLPRISFRRLRA
ncbi:hypothetical protein SAY87_030035 [Trapa incisa]|uniref:Uncharacterized protein n=1 Tax=Trapa incisa TaxID=236973 RepID=A0AAN7Q9Q6_9MYRT|nr:hypothetical protein SAY87_030035 [Trapa incisa]